MIMPGQRGKAAVRARAQSANVRGARSRRSATVGVTRLPSYSPATEAEERLHHVRWHGRRHPGPGRRVRFRVQPQPATEYLVEDLQPVRGGQRLRTG
jgi:hypothetical protein